MNTQSEAIKEPLMLGNLDGLTGSHFRRSASTTRRSSDFSKDEGIKENTSAEILSKLRPVFNKEGKLRLVMLVL